MICSRLHCRNKTGFESSFHSGPSLLSRPPCLWRTFPSFLLSFPAHARGTARRRWFTGETVTPILISRLSSSLSGGLMVNFCKREVKKINSSALANCSPGHTRFPERQEHKTSYLSSWCRCPEGLKASLMEGGPAGSRGFLYRGSFNLTTPGLSKAQSLCEDSL